MAIGELYDVVFDCPDPAVLAEFYRQVVGGEIVDSDSDWFTLATPNGRRVSFQRVDDYTPPRWPGQGLPQQIHLDVMVANLEAPSGLIELRDRSVLLGCAGGKNLTIGHDASVGDGKPAVVPLPPWSAFP